MSSGSLSVVQLANPRGLTPTSATSPLDLRTIQCHVAEGELGGRAAEAAIYDGGIDRHRGMREPALNNP
jgi:hypothetical protein